MVSARRAAESYDLWALPGSLCPLLDDSPVFPARWGRELRDAAPPRLHPCWSGRRAEAIEQSGWLWVRSFVRRLRCQRSVVMILGNWPVGLKSALNCAESWSVICLIRCRCREKYQSKVEVHTSSPLTTLQHAYFCLKMLARPSGGVSLELIPHTSRLLSPGYRKLGGV